MTVHLTILAFIFFAISIILGIRAILVGLCCNGSIRKYVVCFSVWTLTAPFVSDAGSVAPLYSIK